MAQLTCRTERRPFPSGGYLSLGTKKTDKTTEYRSEIMARTNIAIRGQLVLETHASDRYRRHRTGSIVTGQVASSQDS